MLQGLQKRWKVNGRQALIILCVFAVTGTATAYLSKVITGWVGFDDTTFWLWKFLLRVGMLLFGYQLLLLFTAFVFGQFSFFWQYEKKILKRLGLMNNIKEGVADEKKFHSGKIKMALFASGTGTNAQKIIEYFRNSELALPALIVCNKKGAGVLQVAAIENIPTLLIEKKQFSEGDAYLPDLQKEGIEYIVLAGFLWKVPQTLIEAYPKRIINIHPALLPKYGGQGMYGQKVHEAVLQNKEDASGITIHYVDEQYDNGAIIFQTKCSIEKEDTAQTLAARIHQLEHHWYPQVIESELKKVKTL
ncbi:MAG: phosphoribosylglycinamide formyltransferase [Chitinophagaceae bacterium]